MIEEHPFAQYIRTLGKGKQGSRALSEAEAHDAMRMILAGEVAPVQLGAFLMLLRVKEETPAEIAGMVRAVRATFVLPAQAPSVDLDWSSYAGKRRQLPWFLLSALLLAEMGVTVFMHGIDGHTPGRVYTGQALAALGIPPCESPVQAAETLARERFAYLPLAHLSPVVQEMIQLRAMLGLRSPLHTVARLLNPWGAPYLMQGIFHPGYAPMHQQAALLLGQPHAAVFKGEGGEIERNPDVACTVLSVDDGVLGEQTWPALFSSRHMKDEHMDLARLPGLWRGDIDDEYATAAVVSTAAIALRLLGKAATADEALGLARTAWQGRTRERYTGAYRRAS
jgi:anthranilate phosphoribosyltransferase